MSILCVGPCLSFHLLLEFPATLLLGALDVTSKKLWRESPCIKGVSGDSFCARIAMLALLLGFGPVHAGSNGWAVAFMLLLVLPVPVLAWRVGASQSGLKLIDVLILYLHPLSSRLHRSVRGLPRAILADGKGHLPTQPPLMLHLTTLRAVRKLVLPLVLMIGELRGACS